MRSPRLDDDPFSFGFLRLIPSISTFRISFLPRLALAIFFLLTVCCLVLHPTTTSPSLE
jgi:hypothetical protein